jgi:hypothetical protein
MFEKRIARIFVVKHKMSVICDSFLSLSILYLEFVAIVEVSSIIIAHITSWLKVFLNFLTLRSNLSNQ